LQSNFVPATGVISSQKMLIVAAILFNLSLMNTKFTPKTHQFPHFPFHFSRNNSLKLPPPASPPTNHEFRVTIYDNRKLNFALRFTFLHLIFPFSCLTDLYSLLFARLPGFCPSLFSTNDRAHPQKTPGSLQSRAERIT
jgi:hypothetical protein